MRRFLGHIEPVVTISFVLIVAVLVIVRAVDGWDSTPDPVATDIDRALAEIHRQLDQAEALARDLDARLAVLESQAIEPVDRPAMPAGEGR